MLGRVPKVKFLELTEREFLQAGMPLLSAKQ